MLQEEQTVSFQPIGYEGHTPWFVNLFVVYLLYVLIRTVGGTVRLIWTLRKMKKAQERETSVESSCQGLWETCDAKIRSIRNFSQLTFLLAALVLSWNTINILAGVSAAKAPNLPYVAAELAETLVPFTMGILFYFGQFCCAMFLESLVRRRRYLLESESKQTPALVRMMGHSESIPGE